MLLIDVCDIDGNLKELIILKIMYFNNKIEISFCFKSC